MHDIPTAASVPVRRAPILIKDSDTRFGIVSIFLHWGVALAVVALLFLGLFFIGPLARGPLRSFYLNIHVSIGVTAAPLIIARLCWRVRSGKPKAPAQHPAFMLLANIVWRALLACIVLQLIIGPMIVWLHERPLDVFGLLKIPAPFPSGLSRMRFHAWLFTGVHTFVAWLMLGLIGLHVVGALKHFLIDRDQLLQRMTWPFDPADRSTRRLADQGRSKAK